MASMFVRGEVGPAPPRDGRTPAQCSCDFYSGRPHDRADDSVPVTRPFGDYRCRIDAGSTILLASVEFAEETEN